MKPSILFKVTRKNDGKTWLGRIGFARESTFHNFTTEGEVCPLSDNDLQDWLFRQFHNAEYTITVDSITHAIQEAWGDRSFTMTVDKQGHSQLKEEYYSIGD